MILGALQLHCSCGSAGQKVRALSLRPRAQMPASALMCERLRSLALQPGLPAADRAYRTWRRCTGRHSCSPRPAATDCGVRALASAPISWADFLLRPHGLSTGKVIEIGSGGARTRLAPALARAQRPQLLTEPARHVCAALRRPRTLVSPSPPLPCPRRAAPHMPGAPLALRARALRLRARWRFHWQLPQR